MVAIPASFALALVVLLVMAASTATLGGYLVFTNPPKSESTFVGIGEEKMPDEELG